MLIITKRYIHTAINAIYTGTVIILAIVVILKPSGGYSFKVLN